jgi:tetratricopeptide (TPR) repeat protein
VIRCRPARNGCLPGGLAAGLAPAPAGRYCSPSGEVAKRAARIRPAGLSAHHTITSLVREAMISHRSRAERHSLRQSRTTTVRSRRRPAILALIAVLTMLGAPALGAQAEPARPPLPAGMDPNDWEAWFNYGVKVFRTNPPHSEAAFYWASRLEPSRAEPLFARWAAFWMNRSEEEWRRYTRRTRSTLLNQDVIRADSLRALAFLRNPFVHRGLEIVLYDRLPGRWLETRETKAWHAYSSGNFAEADRQLVRVIRRNPSRSYWYRYDRAVTLVELDRFAEAVQELELLIEELRTRDEDRLAVYQSKHHLLHMIGLLHLQLRNRESARAAFEEALQENAAFAAGYAALAGLSRSQRRSSDALQEYAQAIFISERDPVVRFQYALALHEANRLSAAEEQLRLVTEWEPHYAAPFLQLGRVIEQQGRREEAFTFYERFVTLARWADPQRKIVQQRVEAFRAAGG